MAEINFEQLEIPENAIPESEMHHLGLQNEENNTPKSHKWVRSLVVILVIAIVIGFGIFFAYRYLFAQSKDSSSTVGAVWADLHTTSDSDLDQDGLSNAEEAELATDFWKADTDGDGFSDNDEVKNGYNPNGPGKLTDSKIDFNSLGF